jgi:hypothetical protein
MYVSLDVIKKDINDPNAPSVTPSEVEVLALPTNIRLGW